MSNYTFGNYICELREKKGFSQSQLGEKLGVSNKAVSKWENGGAYPSSELMLPLAKALGVSIETLYAVMSNSKVQKTKLRLFLDSVSNKSKVIIQCAVLYGVVSWLLFLFFGDTPDKTTVLILAPITAILFYAFFGLIFMYAVKNPMASAKGLDIWLAFFGVVIIVFLVSTVVNFVIDIPNGFEPSVGAAIGLLCTYLHAIKKRK